METFQDFVDRQKEKWSKELSENVPIRMEDVGREGSHIYIREAWTFMVQSNLPQKVLSVERLRKVRTEGKLAYTGDTPVGEAEYRIGYWIVGRIGRKKDKWTWGQFCPVVPQSDLFPLIELARKEGTVQE